MNDFFQGAIAVASMVAALFFLRFWWTARDRFFLYFALSFGLEGANRAVMGLIGEIREDFPVAYLVRLISYALILLAITHKNRAQKRSD